MGFSRVEKPPKKGGVAEFLSGPPKGRKWIEVVKNRFKAFELGVVVDKMLQNGTEILSFGSFSHVENEMHSSMHTELDNTEGAATADSVTRREARRHRSRSLWLTRACGEHTAYRAARAT